MKALHHQCSNETAELPIKLAEILVCLNACCTKEEAEVIAEIVLELGIDDDTGSVDDTIFSMQEAIVQNLIDNLDIEEAQAKAIILELKSSDGEDSDDSDGGQNTVEASPLNDDNYEDKDSDDEYLVDGECELCDRFVKLTRHHLIPKSTWSRMQTKLSHAAEADETGDRERARLILGHGLEDLLGDDDGNCGHRGYQFKLSTDKAVLRAILHDTCDICRQCHTTVHKTHTNLELALNYNSIEKLLEDERISKFCKWVSKQKSGKYKRG